MNTETHQKITATHLKRNAYLYVRRARERGGAAGQARGGESRSRGPVRLLSEAVGEVRLDPAKEVQETVRVLFDTFARRGSLNATVGAFRRQPLPVPARVAAGAQK